MHAPSIDDHAHQLAPGRRRPRRRRHHERHPRRADHHARAHVDRRDPRAPRPRWRRRARTPGTTPAPATPRSASSTTRPSGPTARSTSPRPSTINEQFELSRELWHHLGTARPPRPAATVPVHHAAHDVRARRRQRRLPAPPARDAAQAPAVRRPRVQHRPRRRSREWAPLLVDDRDPDEPVAATRAAAGTDVDFGAPDARADRRRRRRAAPRLHLEQRGHASSASARTARGGSRRGPPLERSRRAPHGRARGSCSSAPAAVRCRCCSSSGIPEAKGFGGFPISGQFLRTTNPRDRRAAPGEGLRQGGRRRSADVRAAPRHPRRRRRHGTAVRSVRGLEHEVPQARLVDRPVPVDPAAATSSRCSPSACENLDLVKYLVGEVTRDRHRPPAHAAGVHADRAPARLGAHHRRPARPGDQEGRRRAACWSSAPSWSPSADGSIAGLLGASPGASTAVATMLDLLERCFPERVEAGSRGCAR